MYKITGLLFCLLEGFLVKEFGWIALLWGPIGLILGLFITSQMVLPILLGFPLSISLIKQKQMRSKIFIALLRTPIIWIIQLFVIGFILGWFWPTAANWLYNNQPLNISMTFGSLAVIISSISKKVRKDFRIDFDKVYGRYYTNFKEYNLKYTDINDKEQQKQIEAVIKISTNLYNNTLTVYKDDLLFNLSDSKYRYLIFCLSAMVKSSEDLMKSPDTLIKECQYFYSYYTTKIVNQKEFFKSPIDQQEIENNGAILIKELFNNWSTYYEIIKSGNKATSIISTMIFSTVSNEPAIESDIHRLNELSFYIEFSFPSMRDAFIELIA